MREQLPGPDAARLRGNPRDYEYPVVSVEPHESLPDARRRLVEHAEYGKWELHRSRIYSGGGRRFWLRRKVLRVQRTA